MTGLSAGICGVPSAIATPLVATDLDRIEVRAQLQAQARAVDLKRDSDAILDAVSADEAGEYPDHNVAESLQRLPGISVTRDQGEGRYVVVRGLDAALNSVSVDGIAIGTPESDSRAAPLDLIPSESTERLKVVKSPTPDMPGDSIGGAIQVESASAFDRDGRSLRGKLEASHQSLSGETSPKATFNYSDRLADDRFGVAVGLSWQDRQFQSDNSEGEYSAIDSGDWVMTQQQRRKYYIERKRIGANVNLDWRPDAYNRYYLRSLFSRFDDTETRQSTVIDFDADDIVSNADGTYSAPLDGLSKRVRERTKEQDTLALSFGGEHRLDGVVVDYQAGYSKTRERVDDEMQARFKYNGDDLDAHIDQTGQIPVISLSGDDWISNDNYKFNRFTLSPGRTDDDEYSARVNLRFDDENASYKFGLLGRWRKRAVDANETELSQGPAIDLSDWTEAAPSHRHNSLGQALSSSAMRRYWAASGDQYSADEDDAASNAVSALAEDYRSQEDILAAYAMATWDIGALRVIAGVRVENTQFQASGYQIDVDDAANYSVSSVQAERSYRNVLPGLHLRWNGNEQWSVRAALNKTVSRPSFGQIAPHATIDNDDAEISLGNPELKPYQSLNLDLSLERYLSNGGIVSLGVFHKSIDDYIVETVSRNDAGYDVSMALNGDQAKVYGAEFNWQQKLDFLPDGWNGLLAGLSGTWLQTDFDPGLSARSGEDFTLPRASKHVYSAFVGYENSRLSTRVSAVYRSEYLDEIGQSRGQDIFVAGNTQLDFSLNYQVSDNVQLYFEASNLLDEALERYQGQRWLNQQYEEYGRSFAAGIKVKL